MQPEEWDARYREAAQTNPGRLWQSAPSPDLIAAVSTLPTGRALDVATGDGRNALWLAGIGWQVTAVDSSVGGLEIARARATDAGLTIDWQRGDARDWAPATVFDLVTVTYLQLPDADLRAILARVAGWLAPGGSLVVIGHDVANLVTGAPGPRDPAVLNTPDQLSDAVNGAGLEVTIARTLSRVAPEHAGDDSGATALDTLLVAVRRDRP